MFFCFVAVAEEQIKPLKDEKISVAKEIKLNGENLSKSAIKEDGVEMACQDAGDFNSFSKEIKDNPNVYALPPRCHEREGSLCGYGCVCYFKGTQTICNVCGGRAGWSCDDTAGNSCAPKML